MTQLKDLVVDIKSAWVEYPSLEGFEVEISYLSRPELTSLRKSCMTTKFDRKTRMPRQELDEDKYVREFTDRAVKNWKGLNRQNLETLLVIDGSSTIKELDYSKDNAETLVKYSSEFDDWLTEAVFDLEHFRGSAKGKAVESVREVAE